MHFLVIAMYVCRIGAVICEAKTTARPIKVANECHVTKCSNEEFSMLF